MTDTPEHRLAELGLTLPAPASAAGNYVPACLHGGLLFISGQLPIKDGQVVHKGRLGDTVGLADGQQAARLAALNILGQAKAALGDLGRIERCLRLTGFINAVADFTDHPAVANGASDLLVAALGERGRHSRSAVGVASLPLGSAVEFDAMFAVM